MGFGGEMAELDGKQNMVILQKEKMELPYDPAVLLLGIDVLKKT